MRVVRLTAAGICLLALVSLGLSFLSLADEVRNRKNPYKLKAVESASEERSVDEKPKIDLSTALPKRISGYNTIAYHKVPGFEKTDFEAIYQPASESIADQSPLTVYARISYHKSSKKAIDELRKTSKSYPLQNKAIRFGAINAQSGYKSEMDGYFVGWTSEEFSIIVDASFSVKTPAGGNALLAEHARSVSGAVEARFRQMATP